MVGVIRGVWWCGLFREFCFGWRILRRMKNTRRRHTAHVTILVSLPIRLEKGEVNFKKPVPPLTAHLFHWFVLLNGIVMRKYALRLWLNIIGKICQEIVLQEVIEGCSFLFIFLKLQHQSSSKYRGQSSKFLRSLTLAKKRKLYLERAIDKIGKFLTESLILLECRWRLIHDLTKE